MKLIDKIMCIFKKQKILITHDGAFHADDLFAAATLSILNNGNVKIIRTRNPEIFKKGDYVFDVGGENDPDRDKFDHHQKGGAGQRENGIPYSSFGLVWKKYGEQICGDKEVADFIDRKIVMPVDAIDNGIDVSTSVFKDISDYSISAILKAFYPTWKENSSEVDKIFLNEVQKLIPLLQREIKVAKDEVEGKKLIIEDYNKSADKRIIILSRPFHRYLVRDVLPNFPEPIYYICPSGHSNEWKVETVSMNPQTMDSRKLFPEEWRGYLDGDEKLKKITGISDVIFCHKSGFLCHLKTKESAIALAEKALLS